ELNPEIKGKLEFCKGKTTILSTDKIYSKYSWSNGHNVISTEPTCEVTEAGKYTLKVIDKNGCEGAVSVQVEEYPEPNPQVIGNLTYCQGGFTELQGNDGYVKYTWSGPNIKGESPNRIHKVDQPGKYTLKVIDKNGCEGVVSVQVEEYPEPNPQVIGNLTYCQGGFTELQGNDGYVKYTWSGPNIKGESPNRIHKVDQPGKYTLKVIDKNGCEGVVSVQVEEYPEPNPQVIGNLTYCQGGFTELQGNDGYVKYTWSGPNIKGESPNRIHKVDQPGKYTLKVIDKNGCEGVVSVQVEEYPEPNPQVIGNLTYCQGGFTELQGNDGYVKYTWSGPNIKGESPNRIHKVDQPGKYTLKVIDKNGCEGVVSVQVEEYPEPNPQVIGNLTYCQGGFTELQGNDGYVKYTWSGPNIKGESPNRIHKVDQPGKYTLKVIDKNGCEGVVSVQVEEYPEPNPQVIGNLTYCQGGFTELQGNDGYVKYTWSGPNIKGESPNRIHKVDQPGKYTLKVIDKNGCEGVVSVKVDENKIDVHIIGEKEFCEGDRSTLSSNKVFESYEWSDGINALSNKSEFVVTKSGTYYLTVKYKGCTKTTQITVKAIPYPTISQVIVSNIEGKAEVIVYPKGNYIYSLDSFTWQSSNIFESLNVGFYKVWVKTLLGCTSGPFNFKITDIPNVITPNGDGINDTWKLKNLSVGTHIQIYNRYGKLLFEKQVINKDEIVEWNGKYLGRKVESSSYWYVITLTNGKKITGWIAVRNYNELD
ncbi:T9SS type B sorting domain-containing protein, partial [Apibacter adventoris]|uniref:T9SS type B sorting domain-containing protein n=1 Tax=Apibacter adventoris TaxID=1679466 RepID=UPI000D4855C1